LATFPFNVGIAALILMGRRKSAAQWLLAATLMLWAAADLDGGGPYFISDRTLSYNLAIAANATALVPLVTYMAFVGQAVPTPLARVLRNRLTLIGLGGLGAANAVLYFAAPGTFLACGTPTTGGGWLWCAPDTPVAHAVAAAGSIIPMVLASFTLLCGVQYLLRSPSGTVSRSRAQWYVASFGLWEVAIVGGNLWALLPLDPIVSAQYGIIFWFSGTAGYSLLVVALLRYQLFDFDLKVKWTLKRGTLAAITLAVFFVATAVAEQYLQGYGFVVGGVAIGLFLFAIRPVERAIDRMADRAMPRTTGTPEYLAQRKHEIYRAALEDSLADGAVTAKERAVLVRLARNLDLDGNDALRVEAEVLASAGSGA
jgi:hypothetical protein